MKTKEQWEGKRQKPAIHTHSACLHFLTQPIKYLICGVVVVLQAADPKALYYHPRTLLYALGDHPLGSPWARVLNFEILPLQKQSRS